jgi:CO/xanthine dehydrogenase Mo-binding subunit
MAARALNHQPLERFQVVTGDSLLCPEAETTSGSRQTYFSGNALLGACQHLRERILERAAQLLGTPRETLQLEPDQVVHRTSGRTILLDQIAEGGVLKGYGSYEEQGPRLGPDQCKDPYEIYSYGTQMAEVEINVETGEIKVVRILSAHDSGNIVDLKVAEGQVEGGVAMGLGYALLEEFIPNQTLNYDTYHLPRTIHIPEIKTIFVTGPTPSGPLGAKGLGECPVVVTPAAIANAITQACGVRFFELPITPEKVRAALKGDRS